MAKKSAKKEKELKVVSEVVINDATIITYEDGSVKIIPAPITLTPEKAAELFNSDEDDDEEDDEDEDSEDDSDDEEDEDDSDEDDSDEDDDEEDDDEEDDDSDEEEEDEPLTGEALAAMDFEELEDVCDDKDLDTDPDDFDEEDVEKLRKEIAKELGIKLPKAAKGKRKKK